MSEQGIKELINLIVGEGGLKVCLVKMFLDPFHQIEAVEIKKRWRVKKNSRV